MVAFAQAFSKVERRLITEPQRRVSRGTPIL
jgi:hypothetical protein